jgi:hypothetical protein
MCQLNKCVVLLSVLSLCVMVAGCGTGAGGGKPELKASPEDTVRQSLQTIAKGGPMGSEVGSMMPAIGEIKKTDPAKGEALEKSAKEIMTMFSNPAAAKTKAAEMLKTLEGK